ncbi:hypothetical protein [Alkalinema sp. FACHB-956]|uniref:hypothetical protein n=1 Tax=Alkalinema sp. FACHB-956 TaxID=2692768 RepID=UPI0016866C24|nr:hypothetical protein [Alkalinema sp. FACHB-956]MBD2327951.1 hypothetical protein [Alkalinema sp. FACHB-956]
MRFFSLTFRLPRSFRWVQTIGLMGLILALTIGFPSLAGDKHSPPANPAAHPEFQAIDHPLSHRAIVTIGGLTLMGMELWWFLGSPRPR